jgi:hypothetical protein
MMGWGRKIVGRLLGAVPLFVAIILYGHDTFMQEWEGRFGYGQVEDYGLPQEVMEQFMSYDMDANGYIDPYEFSLLQYHITQVSVTLPVACHLSIACPTTPWVKGGAHVGLGCLRSSKCLTSGDEIGVKWSNVPILDEDGQEFTAQIIGIMGVS